MTMHDPDSVEKWGIFETVISGPNDESMYRKEPVSAEFSIGNRVVPVRGFYAGNGKFKVRYMPDEIGSWSYRAVADFEGEPIVGNFECIEPVEDNHGPVQTRGTKFLYADGTEYFPFGTTCYAWIHQPMELQNQTIRSLKNSPFNKLRMCVFPKHYVFNENEPLHPVFGIADTKNLDFDRFNSEFFDLLDRRIVELGSLGIEVDLILFHPYDRWGHASMSMEQDLRYLRYVVARVSAFRNVWWSFANEFDLMEGKSMPDWDRFFKVVQSEDPSQHLRSIHNCRNFYDHGKPWVTHCSIQHMDTGRVPEWIERYQKPVVLDECRYEGNIHLGWGNITAEEMNHKIWLSVCRGGYGGHGETYVQPDDILWWAKGGALRGDSPARIAFLKSIIDEGPSSSWNPISYGKEWSTIGCEGIYFLTYLGRAQPAYWPVNLEGSAFKVEVIDSWNMTISKLPDLYSGDTRIPLPGRPFIAIRVQRKVS